MNIYEKLLMIQNELKVPKNQKNTFGGYKYRSCEDILEAVKPICNKYKVVLMLSDTLYNVGDRYYIQATARLTDVEANKENEDTCISNTAYAREEESKKGMDGSQITGTASSYARKYALSGLFNLDDTRDADTDEFQKQTKQVKEDDTITKAQADALNDLVKNKGVEKDTALAVMSEYGYKKMSEIKQKDYMTIKVQLETGRKN